MYNTCLVIIRGPPATGKTTIAKKISKKFNRPLLSKDDIKETLFDKIGIKDTNWSQKLGNASYQILYKFSEQLIKAKIPHIIEAPFMGKETEKYFKNLKKKNKELSIVEIILSSDKQILFKRMKKRAKTKQRHPGHFLDYTIKKHDLKTLVNKYPSLNLGKNKVFINTSKFTDKDIKDLYKKLQKINI